MSASPRRVTSDGVVDVTLSLNYNGDGVFGMFALTQMFAWLELESAIGYDWAKTLIETPDETGPVYRSCVVPSSALGKAHAASEQSGSEENAAADEAVEIDLGQEIQEQEIAKDGSAGSSSGDVMITEMAAFQAALEKQTWLKQRNVFDLHALHQNLSMLRFAMEQDLLPKDAHDDILIELLHVAPPGGKTTDDVDEKRRLHQHRKKARRYSNRFIADGEVLRDFPTTFLLDSRKINV